MEIEKSSAAGELAALEDILSALFDSPRDGLPLLERFGSYAGIFAATAKELRSVDGMTERAAEFFVYAGRLLKHALLKELRNLPPNCEHAALVYAAAYFFGGRRPDERVLCLDRSGNVKKIYEIDGAEALRHVVGVAALEKPHSIIWLRYEPHGAKGRVGPRRKREIVRAVAACAKLRVAMLDYIEYRPPYFYSAAAAARCGQWLTDFDRADRAKYVAITPTSKEKKNESSAVRYGWDARSDGRGEVHSGIL